MNFENSDPDQSHGYRPVKRPFPTKRQVNYGQCHDRNPTIGIRLLLTITKVGEERKDSGRGCSSVCTHFGPCSSHVPALDVYLFSGPGIFFRSLGFGLADQNKEFVFDGFCRCLYPSARLLKNSQSIVILL